MEASILLSTGGRVVVGLVGRVRKGESGPGLGSWLCSKQPEVSQCSFQCCFVIDFSRTFHAA
jgi:hypothetical protein